MDSRWGETHRLAKWATKRVQKVSEFQQRHSQKMNK